MPFQLHPPNYILGENPFCFLKFLVAYFSDLGDSHFPFGGYWGIKFFPKVYNPQHILIHYFCFMLLSEDITNHLTYI